MIIVEGPDNSGKSTLCEHLSKKFNIAVEHSGGPPKNNQEILDRTDKLLAEKKLVVRDRFPLFSDWVYGILRPEGSAFNDKDNTFYNYWRILAKMHPLIIYCRPNLDKLLDMKNHEVKEHETLEHVTSVVKNQTKLVLRYDALFDEIPHYGYNYTLGTPNLSIIEGAVKTQLENMIFQHIDMESK